MKRTGRFESEKTNTTQAANKKKPVTLLEVFRLHSGEVNDVYHHQLHREKDFLKDRGFSPKHRQSAQESELGRRKSILVRTESNDQKSGSKNSKRKSRHGVTTESSDTASNPNSISPSPSKLLRQRRVTINENGNQITPSSSQNAINMKDKLIIKQPTEDNLSSKPQKDIFIETDNVLMNTGRSEKNLIETNYSPIDDPRINKRKFKPEINQLHDLNISDIQDDQSKKPSAFPDDHLSDYFQPERGLSNPKHQNSTPNMSDIFRQSHGKSNDEPNLSEIFKQGKDNKSISSETIDIDNVQDLLKAYNFRPQVQITNQSDDEEDFQLQVVQEKELRKAAPQTQKEPTPKNKTSKGKEETKAREQPVKSKSLTPEPKQKEDDVKEQQSRKKSSTAEQSPTPTIKESVKPSKASEVKQQSKSEVTEKKSKKTEEKVTTPKQETKVQKAQKVEQSTPNVELREEKIKSDKRQKEAQEPQPQYFEMTLEKQPKTKQSKHSKQLVSEVLGEHVQVVDKKNTNVFSLQAEQVAESPQQRRTHTFGGSFNENNQDTPTLNKEDARRRTVEVVETFADETPQTYQTGKQTQLVDNFELTRLKEQLANERTRVKLAQVQLAEAQKIIKLLTDKTSGNTERELQERYTSLQMKLAEKDSHIEDLSSHFTRLKVQYKMLQDQFDKIDKPEIDEMLALRESEMAKENTFLKESLESLGIQLTNLMEVKKKEFKQRDKICKLEQDLEDLVMENSRLALACAKLDQSEMEKVELVQKVDELQYENEILVTKTRDLTYQVSLQSTLRDQFKTFVKENIDVFDCDQFKPESTMNQSPYEIDAREDHSISPLVKPRQIEHTNLMTSAKISSAYQQQDSRSNTFSNTYKTVDVKANGPLARGRQYAESNRQQQKRRSTSRTALVVEQQKPAVGVAPNVLDLSRLRKHSKQRNPHLQTQQLIKQLYQH